MDWTKRTHRTEMMVAWVVAAGVAAAGAYDFGQGKAPDGLFAVGDDTRLVLFLGSCLLAALSATALIATNAARPDVALADSVASDAVTSDADLSNSGKPKAGFAVDQAWLRLGVLGVSILPAVLADPTYASLLLAVPLIDIRRRDHESIRTIGTVVVVCLVGWMLISEDTPRVVAEVEAMFGLAIAFFIIIMFGDALRQLDHGLLVETELAQLTERTRLASDLHDSVGHHLLASSIQLQKAKALKDRDPDGSAEAVDFAAQAVGEAISETRMLVDTTRNNHAFRLEPAVRELVRRVVPANTVVTVRMGDNHDQIDPPIQVGIYRVIQEALSNLVRHASATRGEIETTVSDRSIRLLVVDNGTGFKIPAAGLPGGVGNMRKRIEDLGGTFEMASGADGTTLVANVPLHLVPEMRAAQV